jgi:phosphate-selective porin OprO and OprP
MRRGGMAGLVCLLGLGAAGAWAQGMYYREVAKDGRVYVFNLAERYADWEASGELPGAITLEAYGLAGETVVADSEDAIHLYNFRHGRPGDPRPQPKATPGPTVSWREGTTTIFVPDMAQVRISNRVQVRYTHELPDEAVQLAGTAAAGDAKGSFRIRRAKLKIDGWFYKTWLQYEFQVNWPAVSGSNPGALLEDAAVNWDVTHGKRRFMVKVGQFKVPFGRQQLTSANNQQFADRSQVSDTYARGRETGVQLWGRVFGDRLEWRAGAFNGNGLTRTTNDNDAFQYNARVTWQPNGLHPLASAMGTSGPLLSDADLESKDKPIWALAASFEKNDLHRTTTSVDLEDTVFGFDGLFKYRRFSAVGEIFLREREPEATATGEAAARFDSNGWYVQAGYLLNTRRTWEVAGRYGTLDPSSLRSGDDQTEVRAGVSYYYHKHTLKLVADYGRLRNKQTGTTNGELRVQSQFMF